MKSIISDESISRRAFCGALPCAALTTLGFAGMSGHARCESRAISDNEEEKMPGKITAVHAKVIRQEGHCAMGHQTGDTVKFTESGVEGKICIHALYSIMPKIFAMMYEAQFTWLENPDVSTHACPDAFNPVVFEVTRIRE